MGLNGYGTEINDAGELLVVEDNIDKNTLLVGLFLNLNIDIGSRYLHPLIQIGVDPTKDKPYLLFGGGFEIYKSTLSITGGPIWTWEENLDLLKVGDQITSENVLKEDVKYKFQTKPRGFYLGLNINL